MQTKSDFIEWQGFNEIGGKKNFKSQDLLSIKPSFEDRDIKHKRKILSNNNRSQDISSLTAQAQIHDIAQLHQIEKNQNAECDSIKHIVSMVPYF